MADETPVEAPIVEPAEPQEPEPTSPEEPEQPEEPTTPAAPEPEAEEPSVRTDWRTEYFKLKNGKAPEQPQAPQQPQTPAPADDLRSVIREELAPIAQSFAKSKDEEELQATFTKYPDAKKIEKTVRKYMESDAYAKVPVDFIVRALLGAKEGARKQADDAARATRQGGHTRRPTETKQKSAWEMTEAEFNKSVSDLMSGKTQ